MSGSFSYAETKKEAVRCALCGSDDTVVLSQKARDGAAVATRMCRACALIYISPRMTKGEYDTYYKYFYREDRGQEKHREEHPLTKNFDEARKFGRALAQMAESFLQPGLLLDIGSSTGGVLAGFKEVRNDLTILGVEPSTAESAFAQEHAVPTVNALFEDFVKQPLSEKPATIICVQSLNHLLEPGAFIEWAWGTLQADGCLILAVKNFRQQVRRAGRIGAAVQIDHPYMFTPETLRALVESRGFEIVYFDVDEHKKSQYIAENKRRGLSTQHVRLVARKQEKNGHTKAASRARYVSHRIQFFSVYIRLYHLLVYSRHLATLRRRLGF